MSVRNCIRRCHIFDLDFVRLSLTRHQREPSHAESPVNESATTMSLGHCVCRPTTTECSAVRSILSYPVVHFLVIEMGLRCQSVLPPDHRGNQEGET